MHFSGLKQDLRKSEIEGTGVLKAVQVTACGMCCIDLNNDMLKNIWYSLLLKQKIERGKQFYKTVTDIQQQVFKEWKIKNLILESEIVILKTKVISKLVFQSFIKTAPKEIVNKLEKIQKAFRKDSTPEIKYETLCNDYKTAVQVGKLFQIK